MIHLAAIVGGIANFHKLPFTLTAVNNALTGAIVEAAVHHDVERLVYVSSSMVFERATEFPTTEEHVRTAPPRGPPTASRSSPARSTRAPRTTSTGCAYTICRPFNAYGPGELPDRDEPGIAHAVPDLIAKTLSGQRPLQIFGSGEQTRTLTHVDDIADGIVTAMASPAGENEDFNISASQELTRRADRGDHLGGVRQRPRRTSRSSTCRASRSTCSAAGRRSRRRGGCSAGRRGSACARASARPCSGCAVSLTGLRPTSDN